MALAYAVNVMNIWIRDSEVFIPYIDPPSAAVLEKFSSLYQSVGHEEAEKSIVGYRVADISVDEWLKLFSASERAAQNVRQGFSKNIELGYPMPETARKFAAMLASGLPNPAAPQKKKSQVHRDTLLAGVAKKVASSFRIPLGATKTRLSQCPPPICGCVIAASSLYGFGLVVNFPRADAICRNPSLPIEKAEKNSAFSPSPVGPLRRDKRTGKIHITPDEYRADIRDEHVEAYSKAAKRLGIQLPILDGAH